jgi:gamma-glutamylputrescine oxidase
MSVAGNWYQSSATPWTAQPQLLGEQHADVAVLGAGLTGLTTALELAQRGYRVIVLEAQQVGWGASGRSGGQLIFGYGCDQAKLTAQLGLDDSRRLFDWSVEGVALVRSRIAQYQIDCDLVTGHAHAAIKPRQVDELKAWQDDLAQRFDYEGLKLLQGADVQAQIQSSRYRALLLDPRCAHLHPLNYTLGIARAALGAGVIIHEASRVIRIDTPGTDRVVLHTSAGQVQARFAVLAGNAWLGRLEPRLDRRIMPVGTYIGASSVLGAQRAQALIAQRIAVADINFVLDYFRLSADHRLLFGGRVSYSGLDPLALAPRMRSRMLKVFPQLSDVQIEQVWGGMVDITMSRAPDWGRLSPNVYYAQGFSGHGMAATGLAGRVLAEAIDGQSTRLDLYQRIQHRSFPGGPLLRTPALMLAMLWFRLKDVLP